MTESAAPHSWTPERRLAGSTAIEQRRSWTTCGLDSYPKEYERRVVSFFNRALLEPD